MSLSQIKCYNGDMISRRKRKLFFLLIAVCFAAAYLHFGFLPGGLRVRAIQKIEASIPYKIRFAKAVYVPFYGLCLTDFKLGSPEGRVIFTAKRAVLNMRVLPFFQSKKIIISNVHLEEPFYEADLSRRAKKTATEPPHTRMSGQVEIPVIPEEKKISVEDLNEGPNLFLPDNMYLEQVQIHNGTVLVRKNAGEEPVEKLTSVQLRMGFAFPPKLNFEGSFDLGEKVYSTLHLKGVWNLKTEDYVFDMHWQSKHVPGWLLAYEKNLFLQLKEGRFQLDAKLRSDEKDRTSFEAKASLGDGLITVKSANYRGRMDIEAAGQFNFATKRFENYQGKLLAREISIDNLSKNILRLDKIRGEVSFRPNLLSLANIEGIYKNLNFSAEGSIENFQELLLNLSVHSKSDLSKIMNVLPEKQRAAMQDFEVGGDCQALSRIEGSLRDPQAPTAEHFLILQNGSLKSHDGKLHLQNISAEIDSSPAGLKIKNAQFLLKDKKYDASVFLPKEAGASGDLNLKNEDFSLDAEYRWEGSQARVQKARFRNAYLSARFEGFVRNLKNPALDIQGDLSVSLEKASQTTDPKFAFLKGLGLRGTLDGKFSLAGPWNNFTYWNLSVDGHADPLWVHQSVRLDNFEIQIRLSDGILKIPYSHAQLNGGNTGSSWAFDLREERTPFTGKFYASGVNVAEFARSSLIQREISGTGALQFTLLGYLKNPESIQGNGSLDIQKGFLFKTDRFKAMGQLPLVKVEGLTEVTFTDAGANFTVSNKRILTENLTLRSETVNLSLTGSVGFDQTLDMLMQIQFSPQIIEGALDTGGIVPFVVGQASRLIPQYKISGTLSKPISTRE